MRSGRATAVRAAAALDISSSSTQVKMSTLPTCQLAVSYYPIFDYKAGDGGGRGTVKDLGSGKLQLTFDPTGDSARLGSGGGACIHANSSERCSSRPDASQEDSPPSCHPAAPQNPLLPPLLPPALNIPALNYKTASIFGIPIPPPLNIAIIPQRFEGELDTATGEMRLNFLARFEFTAGGFAAAWAVAVARCVWCLGVWLFES